MHLLFSLPLSFAVQLYWLSILLVGYVAVLAVKQRLDPKFFNDWSALPFLAKVLIALSFSFGIFGVFTLVGYAFGLAPWWLSVIYLLPLLVALIMSIGYVRLQILADIKSMRKTVASTRWLSPAGVLVLAIVADFVISIYMGSFLRGDAPVHVAKLQHLLHSGFTLTDGYYGTVPETRHTFSVLHTLLAIPGRFGVTPVASWFLSIGFLKFIKLASIYYLSWQILDGLKVDVRKSVACLTTILGITLFGSYITIYPTNFANVWAILFVVGLLELLRHKNYWIIVLASFLLAMTHPLTALGMFMILVISLFGVSLFDRKVLSKKVIISLGVSTLLLLASPLYALTLPNRMTETAKNSGSSLLSFVHVLNLTAFRPSFAQFTAQKTGWALILLGLVGAGYLLVIAKRKTDKVVVASSMLLLPAAFYNPLTYTVISKFLPAWAINRFAGLDQFVYLFVPLGVMAVMFFAARLFFKSKYDAEINKDIIISTALLIVVLIFAFTYKPNILARNENSSKDYYAWQHSLYLNMQNLKQIAPQGTNAIVVADFDDSLYLPDVSTLRVVAIPDSRSTPAADTTHRVSCLNEIITNPTTTLLKQVNASYVLVKEKTTFASKVSVNHDLVYVSSAGGRTLYSVQGSVLKANDPRCTFSESN